MGQISKNIASALADTASTVVEVSLLLGGGALISYGAWLAYRPAGFMVGGALLVAGVILKARGGG